MISSYVQQGSRALRRWAVDPKIRVTARAIGYFLAGFLLSAASLANGFLPLSLALTCACSGWSAVLTAVGGLLGYWCFWGSAVAQTGLWLGTGLAISLLMGDRRICRTAPWLLPATAGLTVAVSGLVFQSLGADTGALAQYLLQVVLAVACTRLFTQVLQGRDPVLDWLACAFGVLALAQILPFPYLGLGFIAAGVICSAAAFPAAALAGLALDLARVTPVPMTAVMALGYLIRFLPRSNPWLCRLSVGAVYIAVAALVGTWDLHPLPGLLLGALGSSLLPPWGRTAHRRGETGVAQVRLEMAAGVLSQTQLLLMETVQAPVDESALVTRAAERACGSCPYRKSCKDSRRIAQLPGPVLQKDLLSAEELPIVCRKSGRFLAELHRSQEQLRSIRRDRERQREYREALVQQYQFLSQFLQELSDRLTRRNETVRVVYEPQVYLFGNRSEEENGDRCLQFMGTGCYYYVLLCDGMGTGPGAVQEGRMAAGLLRRLLAAGYPAEYALRSINSLCALRDRAGAVTVDLVQLRLDNGKAVLYKWGAPASYLVSELGVQKLGSVGPPPGLSVTDCREQTDRFTLRREQSLVMVSDGVTEADALRSCLEGREETPRELAHRLLDQCHLAGDDATVAIIRLTPRKEGKES